jgi:hypothetical protein
VQSESPFQPHVLRIQYRNQPVDGLLWISRMARLDMLGDDDAGTLDGVDEDFLIGHASS